MIRLARSLGIAAIVAGIVGFFWGAAAWGGEFGMIVNMPLNILIYGGLIWGPFLSAAGAIAFVISGRRQTPGEWVGWAFIISGLGWGIITLGYLAWIFFMNPEVTTTGLVSALVLIAIGIGILGWERSAEERVAAP